MAYFETTPSASADYIEDKKKSVEMYAKDKEFRELSNIWRAMSLERKYMHNFSWLGRPLIQLPMDAMVLQEIIWTIKPDLIIETGVAHGGSLILSASILELLGEEGEVVGIDIEIRKHNREAIENHLLSPRITLIEGSSVDDKIIEQVKKYAVNKKKVVVCLDSDHTHKHVLAELNAYADLVSVGSYCIVFDTFIEDMPDDYCWRDRSWGKGNNPKTAIQEWIKEHPEFTIDKSLEDRLMITSAPDGFLYRSH